MEDWHEFVVPAGTTEARWVRAVDLLPGTPSIVRSATILVQASATTSGEPAEPDATARPPSPNTCSRCWLPGQDPEPADGAAFRLPAGAQLAVRIHYKKTWQFEGKALTDRSTVGIYFAKDSRRAGAADVCARVAGRRGKRHEGPHLQPDAQRRSCRRWRVSPDDVPPNISLQMVAIRPDGSRTPMIRLNTRPDWSRRYWFERPLRCRAARASRSPRSSTTRTSSPRPSVGASASRRSRGGPLRLTLQRRPSERQTLGAIDLTDSLANR